ncbi:hypothetical protein EPO15_00925 [bacterium]|nr:MAG: hypothetical protein EPO15_00925 [bacterium]
MTQLLLLLTLLSPAPRTTPSDDCLKTRACAAKTDYEICLYPKKCAPKAVAPVGITGPCAWPRVCASESAAVAQFQPCVWPNPCAKKAAAPVVAQFQPCVWPNKCSGRRSETPLI